MVATLMAGLSFTFTSRLISNTCALFTLSPFPFYEAVGGEKAHQRLSKSHQKKKSEPALESKEEDCAPNLTEHHRCISWCLQNLLHQVTAAFQKNNYTGKYKFGLYLPKCFSPFFIIQIFALCSAVIALTSWSPFAFSVFLPCTILVLLLRFMTHFPISRVSGSLFFSPRLCSPIPISSVSPLK